MTSYLYRTLMLSALASLMFAGGCVSQDQYKEALAAARRANDQLTQCQGALKEMRLENQGLKDALTQRDAAIQGRDQQISLLQTNNNKLAQDLKDLYAKYTEAIGGNKPAPIGGVLLPEQLDAALKEFAKNHPDVVVYLPEYGMVKLKSDLTFEPGSVDIKTASGDALRQLVQILQGPAAAKFNIFIAGHTDDIPIVKPETRQQHPNNWYLSVHRSVAVEQVMTKAGMDPKRVAVMGFGEYHPIAPNAAGNKGNVANRRVEIWIVPQDKFLTAPGQ